MGKQLDDMKAAAATGGKKKNGKPKLRHPLMPTMGRVPPSVPPGVLAALPPGQPPKRVCRRCGGRYLNDEALAAHACTNPKPDRTASGRDKRVSDRGRLPIGSHYVTPTWNGEQWGTVLRVPIAEREGAIEYKDFAGCGEGLFKLLEQLDTKYRDWLKAQVVA